MKLFFYDLETTGVLPHKNGIHQIAGYIDVDGVIEHRFDFKVQPNPKALIEQAALDAGNVTREQIMAYPPMREVYVQLESLLAKYVDKYDPKDKFFLVGYNSRSFDDNFLRGFWKQNNPPDQDYFGSWFWSSGIDIMVMAANDLKEERAKMKNFKLATVAERYGLQIEDESLHDAMYDIMLTRDIYYAINEPVVSMDKQIIIKQFLDWTKKNVEKLPKNISSDDLLKMYTQ